MANQHDLKWRVVGASVTGSSHGSSGRGCDDAHAFAILPDDVLFLAVADGAGSAARSAEGAQMAVSVAVQMAQKLFDAAKFATDNWWWQSYLLMILKQVRTELNHKAKQEQTPLRDFATTLLLAAVAADKIIILQIGDGAIVVQNNAGELITISSAPQTEHLNETVFVTSDDYTQHLNLQSSPFPALQGVAMLTDGLQMLALNLADNKAHGPFFGPLFKFAANSNLSTETLNTQLTAFLDSERVNSITDDDKTLLLAVRS